MQFGAFGPGAPGYPQIVANIGLFPSLFGLAFVSTAAVCVCVCTPRLRPCCMYLQHKCALSYLSPSFSLRSLLSRDSLAMETRALHMLMPV
jgi:hypothetical protein